MRALPTSVCHKESPQFPILSCGFRETSWIKCSVPESRSISHEISLLEAPGPAEGFAHFLCKQQKCLHLHRELGLRPLEAGGKTHHGTGLPQGATILRLWACSCRGRKQGDTAGTRAVELQGLGHFVIELSLLLPTAKQTNRKDISPEREKVFDLDCAV